MALGSASPSLVKTRLVVTGGNLKGQTGNHGRPPTPPQPGAEPPSSLRAEASQTPLVEETGGDTGPHKRVIHKKKKQILRLSVS